MHACNPFFDFIFFNLNIVKGRNKIKINPIVTRLLKAYCESTSNGITNILAKANENGVDVNFLATIKITATAS